MSTLEDIVAEKLRTFLQQSIRNRWRPQDLLDIAVVLRADPPIDRSLVAAFLLLKAAARDVPVSRVAFRRDDLTERARADYAHRELTTRVLFVPFDDALAALYRFVDELPIPEAQRVRPAVEQLLPAAPS